MCAYFFVRCGRVPGARREADTICIREPSAVSHGRLEVAFGLWVSHETAGSKATALQAVAYQQLFHGPRFTLDAVVSMCGFGSGPIHGKVPSILLIALSSVPA